MAMQLSEIQKSALLEAGNIGSGHAAIALSQIMGKKIMIAIPSIEVIEISKIASVVSDKECDVVLVRLLVYGDAKGAMVFLMEKEMAHILCDLGMGQPRGTTNLLGELETSALKEVGSILSASYLSALSEMTGLSMLVSTPESSIGSVDKMRDFLATTIVKQDSELDVFCIRTEFMQLETKIDGYLIFVPACNAIKTLVDTLVG